jgi:hypothetical protein
MRRTWGTLRTYCFDLSIENSCARHGPIAAPLLRFVSQRFVFQVNDPSNSFILSIQHLLVIGLADLVHVINLYTIREPL